MLKGYLTADVTTNHADVLLLSCCFISGMVDSTIYHAYGTFVSMQTGLFGALPPHLLLQWLFPEVLTTKQAILYFWASVAPGRTTPRIRTDGPNRSPPSSVSAWAALSSRVLRASLGHSDAAPSFSPSSSNLARSSLRQPYSKRVWSMEFLQKSQTTSTGAQRFRLLY